MVETYSNLSYYQIEAKALADWDNFEALVLTHDYLARNRQTEFAFELRDRIENRLSELVREKWNKLYSLEFLESQIEELGNPRLNTLLGEIGARIDELFQEDESFAWPSTAAAPGTNSELDNYREATSLLSILGYRTGEKARKEGLIESKRHRILREIYELSITHDIQQHLPDADEWGGPKTSTRLRRMVYCSAESTKDMKRKRSGDYQTAIDQREADLEWMKETFYIGRYEKYWEYATTNI